MSKLQFLRTKNPAVNFFQFLIKTLDPELNPDPQLEKNWIRTRIKSMRDSQTWYIKFTPNYKCTFLQVSEQQTS
jgi:hypothetical protein